MLNNIIMILIFAIVFLVCCLILANYWLHKVRHQPNEGPGKARIGTRTAFALTHFWGAVEDAKELPNVTLKEEMSKVDNGTIEDMK